MVERMLRFVLVAGATLALLIAAGCAESDIQDSGDGAGAGDAMGDTPVVCIPSCEWRECGPEPECGQSCGSCAEGELCYKGSCIDEQCQPDCDAVECGPDPVCGAYCAECPEGETCREGLCVEGTCEPDCTGLECGPDPVCFVNCGMCVGGWRCEGGQCVEGPCEPQCGARECGPDPRCGESCGECGIGAECDDSGTCVPLCVPDCDQRECGPDPNCGESCGSCDEGCLCTMAGACVCDCAPDCTGLACGPDPNCGTSCGECGEGFHCEAGACEPDACEPQCDERECGPDPVCGVSCGSCEEGCVCASDGQCLCGDLGACANEPDLAILNGLDPVDVATQCVIASGCGQDQACIAECMVTTYGLSADCAGCYGSLSVCGLQRCLSDCVGGGGVDTCLVCLEAQCMDDFEDCAGIRIAPCEPQCGGLDCGPDPVCGQSCGTCDFGYRCDEGLCVEEPCEPQCGDLECGPDPVCGQSCGLCDFGLVCQRGRCVTDSNPGACNNLEDLLVLNTLDASEVAITCVIEAGCGTDEACIAECISENYGVSPDCALCYGGLSVCGLQNCAADCLSGTDQACLDCIGLNCQDDFEACAGITWNPTPCEPRCGDRECGPDPLCGESCGTCGATERCQAGFCVPDVQEQACNNPSDLRILNDVDTIALANACVINGGCGTDSACIARCIRDQTGLSADCADCWGDLAVCGLNACLVPCLQDPGSQVCMGCITDNCADDFEACAGVTWTGGGTCVPNCRGLECGPDPVCGESCGRCPAGESCQAGLCVPESQGACMSQSDLQILSTLDYGAILQTCVMQCFSDLACMSDCVQTETGLSEGCSACVGGAAVCASQSCLLPCATDPGGQTCQTCVVDNCGDDFLACSGIPIAL